MALDKRNRIRGSLLGGAVGDALGYGVEFWDEYELQSRFGKGGIATMAQAAEIVGEPVALFSDDTQMTLFTAAGLLYGKDQRDEPQIDDIWLAYREWLATQGDASRMEDPAHPKLELTRVKALHSLRAPGNTCLSSIRGTSGGTLSEPVNNSKGCGGIMRVAPIGMVAAGDATWAASMAARAAALTHGHPLGWLPAAALAHMVALLSAGEGDLRHVVEESSAAVAAMYKSYPEAAQQHEGVLRALDLAQKGPASREEELASIHELGEGWVGEEALYLSVYAAIRYEDDFAAALRCAVNHRGDSDSTGAICGNILGAYLGIDAVDAAFDLALLEQRPLLEHMAAELAAW